MYSVEKIILIGEGIACFAAIWFIPRNKADKASFIYLLTQFFTWILGIIVVELGWIDYPVRELSKANSTSFLFEFFVLPIICIFFILHYPFNKPLRFRILHYVIFSSAFTLVEFIVEKYTMIVKYNSWRWYWTWISMSLVFYMVMIIYKWFYKVKRISSI